MAEFLILMYDDDDIGNYDEDDCMGNEQHLMREKDNNDGEYDAMMGV
jgi:hypothetical protein